MTATDASSYLAIVKDELGSRLQPAAQPGMHQQVAMCGHRILARLVADARHLPALNTVAMDSYLHLTAALKSLLTLGDGPRLIAELEAQLQGERDYRQVEATIQQVCVLLSGRNDATSRKWLAQIIAIERRLKSDFMSAYAEEISNSNVDAGDRAVFSLEQTQKLLFWLRDRFPGNDAMEIDGVKLIPGGFSKQTIFVTLRNASDLPATVVIRLDWSDSAVGTTVLDEFHIIETLFKAGVAVPQPFALESTGDILGGPFLVVSRIDGNNIGDYLDVQRGSKIFALDLARTLAKLHSVPAAAFGDAVAGAQETTRERMLREIAGFEANWRALDEPSLALETTFAWLKRNIDLADGRRSLIHKDIGCHNILVKEDGTLAALLDWETAAIGNPVQDLGYAYPSVVQMCDWDEFIAAYVGAGAPPPSQEQIDYYTLWGYTWLNVMLMQARAAFTSGAAPDIRLGYAGAYFVARLQARLGTQLDKVIQREQP